MVNQIKYVQCVMRRTIDGGSVQTTSYIPQQFAKLGRILKLKDECERWEDGWLVEYVGHAVMATADVPDYRKAIRNHRKSTGDSQPRLK